LVALKPSVKETFPFVPIPKACFSSHRRRISMLEWHPTADNILLSSGYDHRIAVWNVARGEAVNFIDCHPDVIYSMSLNRSVF